jgi:hypothetical protein
VPPKKPPRIHFNQKIKKQYKQTLAMGCPFCISGARYGFVLAASFLFSAICVDSLGREGWCSVLESKPSNWPMQIGF